MPAQGVRFARNRTKRKWPESPFCWHCCSAQPRSCSSKRRPRFPSAPWASDVCSTSHLFCQHPEYLAYAGGMLLIIAVGAKIGSIAN